MTHVFHDALPGFDARNIWHDGCPECEARAARLPESINDLDADNFRRAWADMLADRWSDGEGLGDRRVSSCDYWLTRTLYAFAVAMQRFTGSDPRATLAAIDLRTATLKALS